jgi:hypothetical protein
MCIYVQYVCIHEASMSNAGRLAWGRAQFQSSNHAMPSRDTTDGCITEGTYTGKSEVRSRRSPLPTTELLSSLPPSLCSLEYAVPPCFHNQTDHNFAQVDPTKIQKKW